MNPTSLVRLKNRTAPIHPQSEGVYRNDLPKKKYKEIYAENPVRLNWEEEIVPSSTPPPMNPYKTQVKRTEKTVYSAEGKVRKENSPCIDDLMGIRQVFLKEKELEKSRDIHRQRQIEIISKLEEALGKGTIIDDITIEEEFVNYDDDNETPAEFKERSIFIKERKYVAGRCSAALHETMTKFQIYRLATRIYWSLTSTRDRPVSQVLPWMHIGSKSWAANLQYLMDNGFTHILNVTQEVPNYHPEKFIYQRIPISDSESEDASTRFKKAISFIQRVARSRGKIYIHCNAGNSRAPTMVMAYFIAVRKITLKDIFDYLQLVRISVFPNRHFLFQLSDLELSEGLGSSVRYAEEWKYYEYNSASAKSRPVFREPEGVFTTTCKIHSAENSRLDFVDELEAELNRRLTRERNHVSQAFSVKV